MGAAAQAYVKGARVFHCPGDDHIAAHRLNDDDWGRDWTTAGTNSPGYKMSYRYLYVPAGGNFTSARRVNGRPQLTHQPDRFAGFERHNIRQKGAASLVVMHDMFPLQLDWRGDEHGDSGHGAGWNVLYLDGHVTWVPPDAAEKQFRQQFGAQQPTRADLPVVHTWLRTLDQNPAP